MKSVRVRRSVSIDAEMLAITVSITLVKALMYDSTRQKVLRLVAQYFGYVLVQA